MNIDPWILAFSAITVVATIWMGFWAARRSKTTSDFFVAGRSVSVGWNASAISGEYLSAASFMGVAGMVMAVGYDALWYPVCYACGYLFLLLFIAGPLRRFGAYTVPDLAEGRFDSPVFRKIAVVFVLFIGFFYTMPQMKGAGTTLAYIFPGLPYWAGVVLVGAVITLNVALGGMKGITLVQAFQYWAKMFAISVPIFVLMAVYGHYGKQLGANGGNIQHPTLNIQRSMNLQPVVTSVPFKIGNETNSFTATNGYVFFVGEPDNDMRSLETGLKQGVGNFAKELAQDMAWKAEGGIETSNKMVTRGVEFSPTYIFLAAKQLSSFAGGRPVLVSERLDFTTNYGKMSITYTSTVDRIARTEHWLAERGVAMVRSKHDFRLVSMALKAETEAAVSIESSQLSAERKLLPEKAPADSTWLSPFGPLTTKAARAAGITGDDAKPYSLLYTYSLIIALVCGTAGLPHILVRFYTNPDGVAAKRTTMWVMILIGVFYVFPPVFGVMGRNLMPELYAATGAKGTDKIVLELPLLLNAKYPPLGSILSGITCAGAFAAFMSTFSGLLVSMTGAMAHDVYGRMLNPKATAEQRLRAFKIAAVVVGGVAILLGTLVEPLQINFMVGQAFAIAAASYFPFLFMCAWWRNLTMKGAATGMLTGGLLAVASISLTSFSDLAKATDKTAEIFAVFKPMNDFWAGHPLLRILCEQPAIWAVPLAIVLMFIVSRLTRSEVPSDIRMKMLVLHAPEKLGLKQEYIQEHQVH